MNIVDLRGQLHRNPNGGPNATTTTRTGIVIHYNGPPPNPDAVTQYTNDAVYHANKDWGQGNYGDGIMYHWGIGADGTAYQLRDENAALWHCGTQENYTALSINVNIGEGINATPEQIATLVALCDQKREQYGIDPSRVFGHQELSSTSCPGTLMNDFVYPYRAGGMVVSDFVKFDQTGHGVEGAIRVFFEHNGGVVVHGYPISDLVDDPFGGGLKVQFFERSIMELHPENQHPNDVQVRRLGAQAAVAAGLSGPGCQYP